MNSIITILFLLTLALTLAQHPVQIPGFISLAHGLGSGAVILVDNRRIVIQGFKYDGAGPDAYFVVGRGTPSTLTARKIQNELGSSDVLRGYLGEDIELTLPADLTWNDVDYLSVYCIAFNENFGHIAIPKGLQLAESL